MGREGTVMLLGLIGVTLLTGTVRAQEDAPVSQGLKIRGFYLGMPKSAVHQLYEKMQNDAVAQFISMESSEFRDLITLDREFGSMGNKIEVQYAESGEATYFKFQYKTVAVLWDYGEIEASEFVSKFCEQYGIPDMEFEDMGIVKIWNHADQDAGYELSIDDSRNITLQLP
ncbi:MAG: hypothetical protein AMS18_14375 [Gemmatimonas sp. SG8_17]|nr:MAG: hypothetical protein AMS18_14375 [Gemmatimonas sp. SG8_17]